MSFAVCTAKFCFAHYEHGIIMSTVIDNFRLLKMFQ